MVDRLGARRGSLPVPDRQHIGLTTYDAKDPDTSFPPIEPLLPPEGAPNVLIVLLDDVGYGAGSPFRMIIPSTAESAAKRIVSSKHTGTNCGQLFKGFPAMLIG